MNIAKRARSIRMRQLLLLTAGVVGAVSMPLAIVFESQGDLFVLSSAATMLIVPLGYFLFAAGIEGAMKDLTAEPGKPLRWLAIATFVPMLGSIIEVVVLRGLARETARIAGATDRTMLVQWLAIGRLVVGWVFGPMFSVLFLTISGGNEAFAIAYAVGPLTSFALLGFITQIIATPVLDQVIERVDVKLGAAGASSSMAVSSQVDS